MSPGLALGIGISLGGAADDAVVEKEEEAPPLLPRDALGVGPERVSSLLRLAAGAAWAAARDLEAALFWPRLPVLL